MKERDIQKLITDYLTARKVRWFRMNSGAMSGSHNGKKWYVRFGQKGMADLLVLIKGRALWIEVKQPGKSMSEEQHAFMLEAAKHHETYYMATSLEDVKAIGL